MPVELIGLIATSDQSETHDSSGPLVDRDYVRRFAKAHEDAGFDRVLIGYASSAPDGLQVAAYAAAHTERLGLPRRAPARASSSPPLAARQFATLDRVRGRPRRAAHDHRRHRRRAAPRRRLPAQGRALRRARDEYLQILKRAWTETRAVQPRRPLLPLRGLRQPRAARSRGSRSTSAAAPRRRTRSAPTQADVYALLARAAGGHRRADRRACRAAPPTGAPSRISVSFRPDPGRDRGAGLGARARASSTRRSRARRR